MDCGRADCTESTDYVLKEDSGDFGRLPEGEQHQNWNSRKLAEYVEKRGLKNYSSMIVTHKITGKVAPHLTDADLKEMGMTVVGDRLRFKQIIMQLGRRERLTAREMPLWKAEEQKYYTTLEKDACTCCGLFPDDPTTYQLSESVIKIKKVDPAKCGPIDCCFYKYSTKNVELSKVKDVEYINVAAPCPQKMLCCADGSDLIEIHPTEGSYNKLVLKINAGGGEEVCKKILTQVEKNQVLQRD